MTLTPNENAVKLLAMLNAMSPSDLETEQRDFLDTVRDLCEQVKDYPFPNEQDYRVVPPPFPG